MSLFGPPDIEKLKKKKRVSSLIRALRHENTKTQIEAMRALGEIGAQEGVGPIAKILNDLSTRRETLKESASGVRRAAIQALGEIGDGSAVEVLRRLWRHTDDRKDRAAVFQALAQIAGPELIGELVTLFERSRVWPHERSVELQASAKKYPERYVQILTDHDCSHVGSQNVGTLS